MILIIDNYDSFTYNLYQVVAQINPDVKIVRNDQITIEEVEKMQPEAIILSPGPGRPEDAGICVELIRRLAPKFPILGVCLGHQAMAVAFGGKVKAAGEMLHGKASLAFHNRTGIYQGLSLPFKAARYHSLVVEKESLPEELLIESETSDGMVMGMRHKEYPCYGVQFHPESILTPEGEKLLRNFLSQVVCHA